MQRLQHLLQSPLRIAVILPLQHLLDRILHHLHQRLPHLQDAPVHMQRPHQRLKRIRQIRFPLPPPVGLLSFAQMQPLPQLQSLRTLRQPAPRNQTGPNLRQPTLRILRQRLKQILRQHQLHHRITKKFQTLVVLALPRRLRRQAGMSQGLPQQLPIDEPVAQCFFQRLHVACSSPCWSLPAPPPKENPFLSNRILCYPGAETVG